MVGLEKSIGVTAVPNATLDFNKITCGTWLGYGPTSSITSHSRMMSVARGTGCACSKRAPAKIASPSATRVKDALALLDCEHLGVQTSLNN